MAMQVFPIPETAWRPADGNTPWQVPSFEALLQTSIVPGFGLGSLVPTFSRASTAYVEQYDGLLTQVLSGEARFQGARRVYNEIPTSSATIAVSGNKTITAVVGTYVFSMGAEATGTSVITFTGTATGSSGTLTANATNRTAKTLTITGAGTIIMTCTTAAAADVQVENVTGQSNQNPGPYVSVGVLSAPYHGLNVDGVKAFDTTNGNTVANSIVTEATGAKINSSTAKFGGLPGTTADVFTSPDSAASSITGDIDIRAHIAATDWTPAAYTGVVVKSQSTGGNISYGLWLDTGSSGKLRFASSPNGSTEHAYLSTVATGFADKTAHWIRATHVTATGVIQFFTSEDGTTWTQLGADVAGTAEGIFDSTSIVRVGLGDDGVWTFTGRIYRAQVYNGIGGTLAVDFNPNDHTSGATFTSSGTGEVWTINGNAKVFGSNADATYGIPAQWDAYGPFGYLAEGARADVLGTTAAIRRTMTDVGWVVGATMTVGSATGVDGVASAAASLTGGAVLATNTILFTTVLGSAQRTFSGVVRRKTGSGTIEMTDNGGTNWTDITATLTSAYKLFQVTRTQANPIVGFRITTNTDAIEVDFNTIEAAAFANPTPIPVNVSKAADVLTYVTAGNISGTQGTAYAEVMSYAVGITAGIIEVNSAGSGHVLYKHAGTDNIATYDGVNFSTSSISALTTVKKAAIAYGGVTLKIVATGGSVTSGTFDGNYSAGASFGVGIYPDGSASALFGTIRGVRVWGVAHSTAYLQAKTA